MVLLPIGSFLAGSLLSLLIPILLLVALVAWYMKFFSRVPETTEPELTHSGVDPKLDPPVDAGSVSSGG
ncbi:MAG TPA: hypothetical protein VGH24_02095 [Solirubrobacteraceae bacterium]